jgi:hypothetical protein
LSLAEKPLAFQSKSNMHPLLERFHDLGFPITWTLLMVGWDGPAKIGRLIQAQDVIDYASNLLGSSEDGDHPAIVRLAVVQKHETDVIESCLRTLSAIEGTDRDLEARKWRYALLERVMEELPKDPLRGLVALTTFWEQFDYPIDGPHLVQGKGNDISPGQYYTVPFFEEMLRKHKAWLENERQLLTWKSDHGHI